MITLLIVASVLCVAVSLRFWPGPQVLAWRRRRLAELELERERVREAWRKEHDRVEREYYRAQNRAFAALGADMAACTPEEYQARSEEFTRRAALISGGT